jgi:V8-like Glu-specific endopeptidase
VVNDWGVIVLREPVAEIQRFLPLHAADNSELALIARHGAITIAGYPSDRPVGTLWRHTERCAALRQSVCCTR